jgi:hypothetical protein
MLLTLAEKPEHKGHLKRVRKHSKNTTTNSGITHPESGYRIPKHKGTVVPPPESLRLSHSRNALHAKQGHKTKKGKKSAVRNKERKGHQHS